MRILALLLVLTPVALATPPQTPVLETLVVTGIQPGPGLWEVRNGGNSLWIMATLSPLPRRFDWEPRELDALVARADRVIRPPSVRLDADVGFFGSLRLLPAALRARNNPDEQTLADVLPPPLYQRWQVQRQRWMPRNRSVERRRPFIAAFMLMEEALEDLDLSQKNVVWKQVERIAKRHDREILPVGVTIKISDPRGALSDFSEQGVDDHACLEATLARLETDTDAMVERANAWAVGDLQTLRELPFESELRVCTLALLGSSALKGLGFEELPTRMVEAWMKEAKASLASYPTTVAVVDLQVLLNPDGLLPALQREGYEIIEPGQEPRGEAALPAEEAASE